MRFLAVLLLIGAVLGAGCDGPAPHRSAPAAASTTSPGTRISPVPEWPRDIVAAPDDLPRGDMEPMAAILRHHDNVWVEGVGTVERLLRDDTKRPRHERFIVRLTPEATLLFAHNIDQAPRVPLKPGQSIRFRGKFEWNRQGGVVHWTHRDGHDRKSGGWIIANGQLYR